MLNKIIYCPLISQLSLKDQKIWIKQLNSSFSSQGQSQIVKIVLNESLTIEQKSQCEVAIVANPLPNDLKVYKSLKWVQSLWAGVDNLVADLSDCSFEIVRLVDPMLSQIMSEAVLSWTLYLHRQMPEYLQQQKARIWKQLPHVLPQERTICILGLGELGHKSALTLSHHGFQVNGWSQSEKYISGINCYYGQSGLFQAIVNADVVVCLLPLTKHTENTLNLSFFMKMKKGASLINFARGGIVEHNDLVKALTIKQLNHAVLDVFEQEPLQNNSELWLNNRLTILPHISAPTHMKSAVKIVVENILNFELYGIFPKGINKDKGY